MDSRTNDSRPLSRRLEGITLSDADDRRVRLGDLWQSRPVVLLFVRHFG